MTGQGVLRNALTGASIVNIVAGALAVVFIIVLLVVIFWVLSRFFPTDAAPPEAENGQAVHRSEEAGEISDQRRSDLAIRISNYVLSSDCPWNVSN